MQQIVLVGPHCQSVSTPALAWAAVANIVKAMDSVRPLQAAPSGAVRVFRRNWPDGLPSAPADEAHHLLAGLDGYRHPRLYVEVGGNEGHPRPRRVAETAAILHANGLLACGPCWATGNYKAEEWDAFRNEPALILIDGVFVIDRSGRNWAGLDAINVHGYWADLGPTIWNALRYVQFWRAGDPPVIISECGRDRVRDGNTGIDEGWIGKGGWHADGIDADTYIAEIADFDGELRADADHVLGATLFGAAPFDDWREKFEVDSIALRLAEITVRQSQPAPVPAPQPPAPQPPKPVEVPMTPSNEIGPGVREMMARLGDSPANPDADEQWDLSITVGKAYLYFYDKSGGGVAVSKRVLVRPDPKE